MFSPFISENQAEYVQYELAVEFPAREQPAAELYTAAQLGDLVAQYNVGHTKNSVMRIVECLLLDIMAVLLVCQCIYNSDISVRYTSEGYVLALCALTLPGVLLFILTGYTIFYPMLHRSWCVTIYEDGFVSTRGRRVIALRWEQIESIWQRISSYSINGLYTVTKHCYTLYAQNGVKLDFDDRYTSVQALGVALNEGVMHLRLPQAITDYEAGHTLDFGPLSVSRLGLSSSGEVLPWDLVRWVETDQHTLSIRQKRRLLCWTQVQSDQVPNIALLLALIDYARR